MLRAVLPRDCEATVTRVEKGRMPHYAAAGGLSVESHT